jgi:hypothetical protein
VYEDWGTELVGPDEVDDDVVTPKVHLVWRNNIQWDEIDTESGQTVKYIRVEIHYEATFDRWTGRLHAYYGAADPYSVDANTFIIGPTGMSATNVGEQYQFDDGASEYSGVFVVWDDTDMENIAMRGGAPLDAYYNALIVRSTYGLPNKTTYFTDLDRDATVQWSAWDYGQVTHAIGAVGVDKGWLFEFHESTGALGTAFQSCGAPDGCPKAEAVAVAGQRLVAGNVSFIDSIETLDSIVWSQIDSAIEFTNYPDGIVYSGTVLTGGHKAWYPTDIIRLADTPGQIKAIQAMGTMMVAVYKTDAIYILAVQSGLAAFRPDLRATGIKGPVGRNAVASISTGMQIFLAEDGGLYVFDGSAPRSLGEQFRAWIGREMDSDYMSRSYIHFDSFHNELHVYYPHKGSEGVVRRGLVVSMDKQPYRGWPVEYPAQGYHPVVDTVIDVDYPCMAAHWADEATRSGDVTGHLWPAAGTPDGTDTSLYPQILFGTEYATGDAYLLKLVEGVDDGQVDVRNPIHCRMRSGIFDFDMPDRQKILLEIEWMFDRVIGSGYCNLNARLFGGQTAKQIGLLGTCTENNLMDYPPYESEFREQARYFAYEVEFDWYSPRPNDLTSSVFWALDADEWTGDAGVTSIAEYATDYKIGGQCLQVTPVGGADAIIYHDDQKVAVEASTEYYMEAWVKNEGASAEDFYMGIRTFDADGALISANFAAIDNISAGAWEKVAHTLTIPATAQTASLTVKQKNSGTMDTWLADSFKLYRTGIDDVGLADPPNFDGALAYVKRGGRRQQVKP